MRRMIVFIGSVAAALTLSSCQTDYPIKAVGEPFAPTFESKHRLACGSASAYVSEFDSERNEKQVWSITSESRTDFFITTVKYGETPNGFVVLTKPSQLRAGRVYTVHFDCPGVSATGFFKIMQDGTGFKLVNVLNASGIERKDL